MKGRVVFHIHLKPGREDDFPSVYGAVRHLVAQGVACSLSPVSPTKQRPIVLDAGSYLDRALG